MSNHPRHKFFLKWLVFLPFIFFYQVTLGRAVFSGIDILKQHVPMKYFNTMAFKSGVFPLWNPVLFKGYPHFAEGQSGPLYLGNVLLYLAPIDMFMRAYNYTVILHFVLGGWFCYLFFRRKDLTPLAAFFASISITFSPFMLLHDSAPSLHQVALFFPLLLLVYDCAMKRPFINTIWGSILTATLLLIGHVQMVVYSFIALVIYAVFVNILDMKPGERRTVFLRSVIFFLVIIVFGGMIAAIQLLPTMELSRFSFRVEGGAATEFYGIGTWLTIPRLASIFYIPALEYNADLLHYGSSLTYFGVMPVLFMFIAWRDETYRRKVLPWLIAFALMYLLGMGLNNPLNKLLIQIPPFSLFRYLGRQAFFAGFFLAYPLAMAIQLIIERGHELVRPGGIWKNTWREVAVMVGLVIFMTLLEINLTKLDD